MAEMLEDGYVFSHRILMYFNKKSIELYGDAFGDPPFPAMKMEPSQQIVDDLRQFADWIEINLQADMDLKGLENDRRDAKPD